MTRVATIVAVGATLLAAGRSAAQCVPAGVDGEVRCPLDAPDWVGQFTVLSANALIGGLTAGVMQHARGESFARGFVRGALGGGAVWAGKWVAAQRFSGAGLAGREVAATGASMIRNAGRGQGFFEELVLPFGPVRFHITPGAPAPVRPKLDVLGTAWLLYGVSERELELDVGGSLSAGAPVFRTDGKILSIGDDSLHAAGIANAGVVFVADVPAYGASLQRRALAHERVHVLQEDQLFLLWTDPAEDWLLERLPGGTHASRFIDLNLSTELLRLLGRFFPDHGERPWEMEAIFLAR
jgi:hypothetical protein